MCFIIRYIKIFTHYKMSQPFILQFICRQLCKGFNCLLKVHNKQLNQYCFNFIIFSTLKNVLKNGSGPELGQVDLQKMSWVTSQPIFTLNKKWIRVGLANFDSFCHV